MLRAGGGFFMCGRCGDEADGGRPGGTDQTAWPGARPSGGPFPFRAGVLAGAGAAGQTAPAARLCGKTAQRGRRFGPGAGVFRRKPRRARRAPGAEQTKQHGPRPAHPAGLFHSERGCLGRGRRSGPNCPRRPPLRQNGPAGTAFWPRGGCFSAKAAQGAARARGGTDQTAWPKARPSGGPFSLRAGVSWPGPAQRAKLPPPPAFAAKRPSGDGVLAPGRLFPAGGGRFSR